MDKLMNTPNDVQRDFLISNASGAELIGILKQLVAMEVSTQAVEYKRYVIYSHILGACVRDDRHKVIQFMLNAQSDLLTSRLVDKLVAIVQPGSNVAKILPPNPPMPKLTPRMTKFLTTLDPQKISCLKILVSDAMFKSFNDTGIHSSAMQIVAKVPNYDDDDLNGMVMLMTYIADRNCKQLEIKPGELLVGAVIAVAKRTLKDVNSEVSTITAHMQTMDLQ